MSAPNLALALERLHITLEDLPPGPVRADLIHALAIARFDADGAGEAVPLHEVDFGPLPAIPEGPMFAELEPGPLADAMDELQRALIWEADVAAFNDANLNCATYLRAAGYLDRAAQELAKSANAPAPS